MGFHALDTFQTKETMSNDLILFEEANKWNRDALAVMWTPPLT